MTDLTEQQRDKLGEVLPPGARGYAWALAPVVARMIAEAKAEALREAARYFEYEMAPAWGGDATWLSTGNRVADVVGDVLRECAADIESGSDA
jgi:hypothetical protein